MAEDDQTQLPQMDDGANDLSEAEGSGMKQFLIMALAVALVGAGAGYGASLMFRGPSRPPQTQPAEAPHDEPARPNPGQDHALTYYDFEAIRANLDEPRLARYVMAKITLAFNASDGSAATAAVTKKLPELKSWLTVYLSGCRLDDIRGPKNLNRISREIQDELNRRLWPDSESLIRKVLFKEIVVQ